MNSSAASSLKARMNRLLDFHDPVVEEEYTLQKNLVFSQLQRVINVIIVGYLVIHTLRYFGSALWDHGFEYMSLVSGLLPLYACFGLYYGLKSCTKKYSVSIGVGDVLLVTLACVGLGVINGPNTQNMRRETAQGYELFWAAYEIGVFSLFIFNLVRKWYYKVVYFTVTSVYFFVINQKSVSDRLEAVKILGFILMVTFVFHFFEKNERLSFIEKNNQEFSLRQILRVVPEGIIIINKNFENLHSNHIFHTLFPDVNLRQVENIEVFFKSIPSPSLQTLGRKFKNLRFAKVLIDTILPRSSSNDSLDSPVSNVSFLSQAKKKQNPNPALRVRGQLLSQNGLVQHSTQAANADTSPRHPLRSPLFQQEPIAADISHQQTDSLSSPSKLIRLSTLKDDVPSLSLYHEKPGEYSPSNSTKSHAAKDSHHSFYCYIKLLFATQYPDFEERILEDSVDRYFFDCKIEEMSFEVMIAPLIFLNQQAFIVMFRDKTYNDLVTKLESSSKQKTEILATVAHELRTPINSSIQFLEALTSSFNIPSDHLSNFLVPVKQLQKMMLNLVNDILDQAQLNQSKLKLCFQQVNIETTVNDTIALIELQAKKRNNVLSVNFARDLPKLFHTDPNRLTQIILNLLTNACKFTANGMISVNVRRAPQTMEQGVVKLEISVTDTGIGIRSTDIKNLFIEFEKVEMEDTTQNSKMNPNGCGLGLTIANKLAKFLSDDESQGICVESQPGKGSIFSFCITDKTKHRKSQFSNFKQKKDQTFDDVVATLGDEEEQDLHSLSNMSEFSASPDHRPLTLPALMSSKMPKYNPSVNNRLFLSFEKLSENASARNEIAYSPISRKSRVSSIYNFQLKYIHVLIVDDDAFNHVALSSLLKARVQSIHSCYNGRDAVKEIKELLQEIQTHGQVSTRNEYDLIFMDCSMPLMNGFDATTEIRRLYQNANRKLPTIVGLSSHTDAKFQQKALDHGMNQYMTKPFTEIDISRILLP